MNQYTHSLINPLPPREKRANRNFPVLDATVIEKTIKDECRDAYLAERHGNGNNKVFVLPEAKWELDHIVSYGRRSPKNHCEQKFNGYGHIFLNPTGHINTVITHFIEIPTKNRGKTSASNLGPNGEYNEGIDFLVYYREEFLKKEREYNTDASGYPVNPFLKNSTGSEFVLEGHTHPDLGVFFSETDRETGFHRAATMPICSFVCDPIRRKMLACIGKNFEAAEIILFDRKSPMMIESNSTLLTSNFTEIDDVVRSVSCHLNKNGYKGYIRAHTRFDGKVSLKIKMIIPKFRRSNDRK